VNLTTLPETLDITAEDLLVQLRDAVGAGRLVLDGQAVQRVDAAGLQLLCAAVTAVTGNVVWMGASPALRDGVRTLGLEAAVGFASMGTP